MTPMLQRLLADPRAKRALRWAGWIFLGLFSFVFALQATFPYQRVADKAIEVLSPRYDVTIGEVDRGWSPGKMILRGVTLRSRPAKPEDPISTMFFEKVEIDVNLIASALGRRLDTELELAVGGGYLAGNIAIGKNDVDVDLEGKDMPADGVPGLADSIGLPMTGKIDPLFQLELPDNDWRQATGRIRLVCPSGCTVGDGVSKLKFKLKPGSRQAAFASEGVTIDKMFIDRFALQVDIGKGKLGITTWELKSKDLEATIDLQVQLAKGIGESTITSGCLKYKPSAELSERAPKTQAALMSTGAPLAPDGNYNILLSGRLGEMKRLPRVCGGDSADSATATGRSRRPSLGRGGPEEPGAETGITTTVPNSPPPTPTPDDVQPQPPPGEPVPPPAPPIGAGAGTNAPPPEVAPALTPGGSTPPQGGALTPPGTPPETAPPGGPEPQPPPPPPPPPEQAPAVEPPAPEAQPVAPPPGEGEIR
jgi:type II secretion system protein N